MDAADEILDGLAFASNQALEFVESPVVDVLRFEPDKDAELVCLQLLQPMRFDEVLVERLGEVLRCQVRLRAESRTCRLNARKGGLVNTYLFRVQVRELVSWNMLGETERREALSNRFVDNLRQSPLGMAGELARVAVMADCHPGRSVCTSAALGCRCAAWWQLSSRGGFEN